MQDNDRELADGHFAACCARYAVLVLLLAFLFSATHAEDPLHKKEKSCMYRNTESLILSTSVVLV